MTVTDSGGAKATHSVQIVVNPEEVDTEPVDDDTGVDKEGDSSSLWIIIIIILVVVVLVLVLLVTRKKKKVEEPEVIPPAAEGDEGPTPPSDVSTQAMVTDVPPTGPPPQVDGLPAAEGPALLPPGEIDDGTEAVPPTSQEVEAGTASDLAPASPEAQIPAQPPPIIAATSGYFNRNVTPYMAGSVIPIKAVKLLGPAIAFNERSFV